MEPDNNANWQYKPDNGEAADEEPAGTRQNLGTTAEAPQPAAKSISWTASEYIDHPHGPGWYTGLITGTIVLAGVIYLVTKEYFATVVTVILGIIVGTYAGRKPHQVAYEITDSGLKIGDKTYYYNQFKSFSIMREGDFSSVNLLSLKRFMPPVSAYFAAEDEETIVSALGEHIPYEERKVDRMDRITSRLRF